MEHKVVTVCACPSCGIPIDVPIKTIASLFAKQRKTPNTPAFMKRISLARWKKHENIN